MNTQQLDPNVPLSATLLLLLLAFPEHLLGGAPPQFGNAAQKSKMKFSYFAFWKFCDIIFGGLRMKKTSETIKGWNEKIVHSEA